MKIDLKPLFKQIDCMIKTKIKEELNKSFEYKLICNNCGLLLQRSLCCNDDKEIYVSVHKCVCKN